MIATSVAAIGNKHPARTAEALVNAVMAAPMMKAAPIQIAMASPLPPINGQKIGRHSLMSAMGRKQTLAQLITRDLLIMRAVAREAALEQGEFAHLERLGREAARA